MATRPKTGFWDSLNVFDKFSLVGAVSGVVLLGYGLNDDIVLNKKVGKVSAGAKSAAKSAGHFLLVVTGIAAVCVGTVKGVANYWQIDKMIEVPSKANAALVPTSSVLSAAVKSAATSLNLKTTASLPPITEDDKKKWDEFVGELEHSWKKSADKRTAMAKEPPKREPSLSQDIVQLAHEKTKSLFQSLGLKRAAPAAPAPAVLASVVPVNSSASTETPASTAARAQGKKA